MRLQLRETQHQLREYNEQKRQQLLKEFETTKKEVASATPSSERRTNSA